VCRVDREHVLAVRPGQLEGLLEQQATRARPSRRTLSAPAFEQHPRLGPTECLRFVEQRVALLEAAPKALHPCELGQHLGAARVGRLVVELDTKTLLAGIEVVEIPQRTQPVAHGSTSVAMGWGSRVRLVVVSGLVLPGHVVILNGTEEWVGV
jgi:hypothetical protein